MKNSFWLVMVVVALGCNRSTGVPPAQATTTNAPAKAEMPAGHPPIGGTGAAQLPAGHPPLDMSTQSLPPDPSRTTGNPQWTAPADWQAGPASSVRRGSWTVAGADGQRADVAVTVFAGEVGGALANLNRWRGQAGLEPLAELPGKPPELVVDGLPARLDEIVNPATNRQIIVVTVPRAGNSWFFKLAGDATVVAAQREAFLKFVQAVKF